MGFPCEVIPLGRGSYELEQDEAAPWGRTFDLVVGAEQGWLGLPGVQFRYRTYAASTILTSLRGPEPVDQMVLQADELLPHGSRIDYRLIGLTDVPAARAGRHPSHGLGERTPDFGTWADRDYRPRSFPIYPAEPITIHQLLERVRFAETVGQDRTLTAELTYTPAVDPVELQSHRYGYNPNYGGGHYQLTLLEPMDAELSGWYTFGAVTPTEYGVSPYVDSYGQDALLGVQIRRHNYWAEAGVSFQAPRGPRDCLTA